MFPTVKSSSLSIPRVSLAIHVAETIRAAILNGEYEFGRRLQETELQVMFGVSSSALREALHTLQGEGLVVSDPYKGRRVFSLTEKDCLDLAVARTGLELQAAYLAAERLTPEAAAGITEAAARFLETEVSSYAGYVELELGFHRAVWSASGNTWLARQISQLTLPLLCVEAQRLITPDADFKAICRNSQELERTNGQNGHQVLAKAILSGNPLQARDQMYLHIPPNPARAIIHARLFAPRSAMENR